MEITGIVTVIVVLLLVFGRLSNNVSSNNSRSVQPERRMCISCSQFIETFNLLDEEVNRRGIVYICIECSHSVQLQFRLYGVREHDQHHSGRNDPTAAHQHEFLHA